jgi:hypothetical protein
MRDLGIETGPPLRVKKREWLHTGIYAYAQHVSRANGLPTLFGNDQRAQQEKQNAARYQQS